MVSTRGIEEKLGEPKSTTKTIKIFSKGEVYIFRYCLGQEMDVISAAIDYLNRPELNFDNKEFIAVCHVLSELSYN